ncbi:MAG TPA: PIN domain-containing protein [Fodinibius sp.]|nr:PIN domain-containing protein [Fodinibius sp.]
MGINNILVDANVCLDAVLNRRPFATNALEIIEWAQWGDLNGSLAAHSFDTIFYFLRKAVGNARACEGLAELRRAFSVAPVTQAVIDKAIGSNWDDFEDAIHYHAAQAAGCGGVVTRNGKDFKKAKLPIMSPQTFIDQFDP